MPLYNTIQVNDSITVYIWKIKESEKDLSRDIELTTQIVKIEWKA